MKTKFLNRISTNPEIFYGHPCIKGTAIPVSLIVSLVAENKTVEKIIADFPLLTKKDIQSALKFDALLHKLIS